jgi:YD repeat-containing protein
MPLPGFMLRLAKPDAPVDTTTLAARFTYNDGSPLNFVKTERFMDTQGALESIAIANAVGELVLAFDKADPSAGDDGTWVVSSWIERDRRGRPTRTFRPWFTSDDPILVSTGKALARPANVGEFDLSYDGFGRLLFVQEGSEIVEQHKYRPLSMEVLDAEQAKLEGPHAGLYEKIEFDGHGRVKRTSAAMHDDTFITETKYLATGEPRAIIQKHATGGESVLRTMLYDSLGRLVKNIEPNTTTNEQSWTYAWDDAGRLVGTSDARGCGENLFYDGLVSSCVS